MSLLGDGAALRSSMRSAAFGNAILYARGSTLSAAITARVAPQVREVETTYGVILQRYTDFIVAAADCVWSQNDAAFLPQSGDRITYNSETYEVADQPPEPCYVLSDHAGVSLRIHTVIVE